LVQFFWPLNLAVLYPHPGPTLPIWKIGVSCLLLLGISAWAIAWRRKCPYLLVGWLWYLGMLVPVIGIVQVGGQAMADRYTYLPQIGLTVALVVGIVQAAGGLPLRRRVCMIASMVAVVVLGICTWRQTTYWQNTETLLQHALACTSGNWQSHRTLAAWLERRGRIEEAILHYEEASDIDPIDVATQNHIGKILASRGQIDAAIVHFGKALDLKPDDAGTCNNMGLALAAKGRLDLAIIGFEKSLAAKPDFAEAHDNLGTAFLRLGQVDAAIAHYRKALQIKPDYMQARSNLAAALARRGNGEVKAPARESPLSQAQPR
jgi:Flp pilus assembly protein TadD